MATPMSPHPTGLPAPNSLSAPIRVPAPTRQAFLETGLECPEDIQADDRCTICFEDFTNLDSAVKIRDCKHVFCREYLLQWLKQSNSCPMCRSQLYKRLRSRRLPRLWRGNDDEGPVQVDMIIRWSINDHGSIFDGEEDDVYEPVSPSDINSDDDSSNDDSNNDDSNNDDSNSDNNNNNNNNNNDDDDDDDDWTLMMVPDERQPNPSSTDPRRYFRLETVQERVLRRMTAHYNRRRREIEAARQKELNTANALRRLRTQVWEGLRRIVSRCWCEPYTLS
jgi:hypothetical protein